MKLKKLGLGFENCDSVDVPGELVNFLFIDELCEQITVIKQEFHSYLKCKYIRMILKSDAAKLVTDWESAENLLGKRLDWNDIASMTLELEDRTIHFYVPWCDKDEFTNKYMQVKRNEKNGDIIITITTEG